MIKLIKPLRVEITPGSQVYIGVCRGSNYVGVTLTQDEARDVIKRLDEILKKEVTESGFGRSEVNGLYRPTTV